jgi:hypothetical protein
VVAAVAAVVALELAPSSGPPVSAVLTVSGPAPAPLPSSGTGPVRAAPPGPVGPVALTGCPPPPTKPGPPAHPWHPTTLVPESTLPVPPPPAPRLANPAMLAGKGMWIWQMKRTEGGDVQAIVRRAAAAGLSQLWVRVGDSRSGYYGSPILADLLPAAHRAGLAVIGWGFPYLYDPAGDASWTMAALNWQAPDGERLDGWGADIETAGEGTALSGRRASAYLGLVRAGMAGRPLVATVFPPTDHWLGVYPYQAMAPYVDAFTPMVYWSCREPGDAVAAAISRLAAMAPVHPLGQAYDMAPEGGRVGPPSPAEIDRFLDVSRRAGAIGASFWDWQEMNDAEWRALSAYPWGLGGVAGTGRAGL